MTSGPGRDDVPRFSPDGKWIAFERDSHELRADRSGVEGREAGGHGDASTRRRSFDSRDVAWSPDSRYLAYLSAGAKTFQNVEHRAVPSGSAASARQRRAASFLANTNARLGVVESGRHVPDVRRPASAPSPATSSAIDLAAADAEVPRGSVPRSVPARSSRRRRPPSPTPIGPTRAHLRPPDLPTGGRRPRRPVEIVCDDIRRRASVLPVGVDVSRQEISPDGKWLLLIAAAAGQQNLYVFSDRRAVDASLPSRGSSRRRPAPSATRTSRRTARRSTTSIAGACSTSRSSGASRGRSP